MKKINLTNVKIRPSLDAPEVEQNLAKEVGNTIYGQSKTVEEFKLGIKLHDAKGEVELNDEEVAILKASLGNFYYWVQQAILKLIDNEKPPK